MTDGQGSALYQAFLPDRSQRAFVWKFAQATGGRRPRHFHSEPELNLLTQGTAKFGVGHRIINARAGDLLAFPSGQDHVLLEASQDLYLFAIGLDRSYASKTLGFCVEPVAPLHVRLEPGELATLTDKAAALVDRKDAAQLGAELWQRVHWLARRAAPSASRGAHVLTRRALQLLAGAPELGLEALAETLRAHPSEISRHFHADLGMTLVRYRRRLRLLQLIDDVDAGEDLMNAACAAGFGSYSQCHRTFHSELGCAPRQFFSGLREQMQVAYEP
jgi:AraC-like DNA-binding protein/quercetin dioxygenase-like cupin family protein